MDQRTTAVLQHVAAMDLLARASTILQRANVRVMPLKGVWLQLEAYDPPHERPVTDVDLLVAEGDFRRAVAALRTAGFAARVPDPRQAVLQRDKDLLAVDLHRALFTPGSFRLTAAQMLARARGPMRLGDAEVWLPDPLDGFAHLVGHAARARDRPRDVRRMRDFEVLARRFALDPVRTAQHLEACGLRRAARYVLDAANPASGPFCQAVVGSLSPDPLGQVLVALCKWSLPRVGLRHRAGGALTYLLEDSVARGGLAFARHARTKVMWRSEARARPR